MDDDWKVGDLALCVDVELRECDGALHVPRSWRLGEVARVALVMPADCGNCLGLVFDDGRRVIAARFRKIRPDKHEGCEPEFVELLNRIKRKVDA